MLGKVVGHFRACVATLAAAIQGLPGGTNLLGMLRTVEAAKIAEVAALRRELEAAKKANARLRQRLRRFASSNQPSIDLASGSGEQAVDEVVQVDMGGP